MVTTFSNHQIYKTPHLIEEINLSFRILAFRGIKIIPNNNSKCISQQRHNYMRK